MWYEILPSAGIIFAALSLPHFASYAANKLILGNGYRRCVDSKEQRIKYLRDWRLTGNPYKINGLEAIPD